MNYNQIGKLKERGSGAIGGEIKQEYIDHNK